MQTTIKRVPALICQVILVLIGGAVLAFLLWEPHLEGRNARATVFEIYFKDPFLAYVYVGSIPFFIAIYRGFRLFGEAGEAAAFSSRSVAALRSIQRCALVLLGFIAGAFGIILLFGDREDRPAGVFMALLATLAAIAVAVGSARSARRLQAALGLPAASRG